MCVQAVVHQYDFPSIGKLFGKRRDFQRPIDFRSPFASIDIAKSRQRFDKHKDRRRPFANAFVIDALTMRCRFTNRFATGNVGAERDRLFVNTNDRLSGS